MKLTFSKKLHGNKTLRFIDIITTDNGMDKRATMIYIPTMREYVTIDYERGINTKIIVGIRYVANCHIRLASTCTLDFSNDDDSTYYHFIEANDDYEYVEFIDRLKHIMDIYS
jgi:hypothetical protein